MKTPTLEEMIVYMRPDGTKHQRRFCNRFIQPIFGQPDAHGNYTHIVGDKPQVAFMAHHDTVHAKSGIQTIQNVDDFLYTVDGNCLGADCTTGVYIILKMIEAKVPGVYVIHAGEEIGCKGSMALVKDHPDWIDHVKAAISFDRKGYKSIITHQMGMRTCSELFADSLSHILDMEHVADPSGSYTDSNEYADVIMECTNLSVGYFNQHTKKESQDLQYLDWLVVSLIEADWSQLIFDRNPAIREYEDWGDWGYKGKATTLGPYENWLAKHDPYKTDYYDTPPDMIDTRMEKLIRDNPDVVAELLESFGYNYEGLIDDINSHKEKQAHNYRKYL